MAPRASSVFARNEALFLATALLTFSYHHVWFSQNARGYTALLFATVLATDLFLRALERGTAGRWLAYAAAIALGMGVHLTMAFVALGHGLIVLGLVARADTRAGGWRGLFALVAAGLLTLAVYAPALPQMLEFYLQPSAGATTADVAWKSPLWLVNEAIRSLGIPLWAGWIAVVAGSVPLVAATVDLWKRSAVAAYAFTLPPLLLLVVLLALERNLWPRFFFNAFGFLALLAFHGLVLCMARVKLSRRAAEGVLVALVVASALTVPRNYQPRQDYTGAADWVRAQARDGDAIVALDLAADAYGRYYAPEFGLADTLDQLRAASSPAGHTYVVYTFGAYIEAREPDLWHVLETEYEEVNAFLGSLGGGAIVVRRTLSEGGK